MFPRISDLINYLLGTRLDIPVQSYGFMMVIAFLAGAWTVRMELKRKEGKGLIHPFLRKYRKGGPAGFSEILFSGLFGFILGWKGVGLITDYAAFSSNPQDYILSLKGSLAGALLFAAFFSFYTFYNKSRKKEAKPVWVEEMVHPYQLTGNIILIAAIFGIIGSKIFDTIEHFGDFLADPAGTIFSFTGLSFYGGLILAAIAVIYYTRRNGIRFVHMADSVAPGLILSYAIGRIGCQLAGDGCWGVANTAPKPSWMSFLPDWTWSFTYPHNVINDGILLPHCEAVHCYVLPTPVFPAPLYETIAGLLIFAFLWSIRKKITIPGILFSIYLILNGTERFFIEKIRVNRIYDIAGMKLTQAEMVAILLVLLGFAGLWYFYKKSRQLPVTKNNKQRQNT
jgi:phosphatidylglycerol---prolipoprotein diacylglyceryl transferase